MAVNPGDILKSVLLGIVVIGAAVAVFSWAHREDTLLIPMPEEDAFIGYDLPADFGIDGADGAVDASVGSEQPWSVDSNVFRHVLAGLEIRAPQGWILRTGEDAKERYGALVVLEHQSQPLHAEFLFERVPERSSANYRERAQGAFVDESIEIKGQRVINVADSTVIFQRYVSTLDEGTTVDHGVRYANGFATEIQVIRRGRGMEANTLAQSMSRVSKISEDEQKAYLKRMTARKFATLVEDTRTIRGLTVTDFKRGFRWTAPDGRWQIKTGTVWPVSDTAILVVQAADRGLTLAIFESDRSATTSGGHQQTIDLMAGEFAKMGRPHARGGHLTSHGSYDLDGMRYSYVAESHRNIHGIVVGHTALIETYRKDVKQALAGLTVPGEMPIELMRKGRFRDNRMGFGLWLRDGEWEQTDSWSDPYARSVTWTRGDESITVVATSLYAAKNPDERLRALEQQTVDRMTAEFEAGEPSLDKQEIAKMATRHYRWREGGKAIDLYVGRKEMRMFEIVTRGKPGYVPRQLWRRLRLY